MLVAHYATKKSLKESVGKSFSYSETSLFGPEWKPNAMLTVVGPDAYNRKWYANVHVDTNNVIVSVK